MEPRTPAEVGEILRQRRDALLLTQEGIEGVSSATVGKIERAAAESFKRNTMTAYLTALGLAPDAYAKLIEGHAIESLVVKPTRWSAYEGGTALERLRQTHPERWRHLEELAESLLGDMER